MYIRIKDLIPGKWYMIKKAVRGDYYFLYTHYKQCAGYKRVYSSKYISGGEIKLNDYFASTSIENSVEEIEDWSIIEQYFPELKSCYEIY